MVTHHLLTELGLADLGPMQLWCGKQAALYIALSNPVFHEKNQAY